MDTQFLVFCPQPGQLRGFSAFRRITRRRWQRPRLLLLAPVFDMRVIQLFLAQQGAALGTAFGQRVKRRQDPCLIRRGERPPRRPAWLLSGHLTILPRHGGLVSKGHRHCLERPVSPCFASKGLTRLVSHSSLTERAAVPGTS